MNVTEPPIPTLTLPLFLFLQVPGRPVLSLTRSFQRYSTTRFESWCSSIELFIALDFRFDGSTFSTFEKEVNEAIVQPLLALYPSKSSAFNHVTVSFKFRVRTHPLVPLLLLQWHRAKLCLCCHSHPLSLRAKKQSTRGSARKSREKREVSKGSNIKRMEGQARSSRSPERLSLKGSNPSHRNSGPWILLLYWQGSFANILISRSQKSRGRLLPDGCIWAHSEIFTLPPDLTRSRPNHI